MLYLLLVSSYFSREFAALYAVEWCVDGYSYLSYIAKFWEVTLL